MEKNKFTHGSLFSGIGGPEIAAEEMGWKNMFHCEINPFGRKILDYWFPNSKSYEDITKTNFTEWRGKINVLTGGFPCQPFSCAGQRKGAEDDRYLWPEMLRAIREIQPDWVVGVMCSHTVRTRMVRTSTTPIVVKMYWHFERNMLMTYCVLYSIGRHNK